MKMEEHYTRLRVEWEKSKKKFIEDRNWFENYRMEQMPRLLRFMGKLRGSEKIIFARAWWMGFFQGQDYSLRLLNSEVKNETTKTKQDNRRNGACQS